MNSFLQDNLNLLQNKNIPCPELELRVLLNKTSVIDKEIIEGSTVDEKCGFRIRFGRGVQGVF